MHEVCQRRINGWRRCSGGVWQDGLLLHRQNRIVQVEQLHVWLHRPTRWRLHDVGACCVLRKQFDLGWKRFYAYDFAEKVARSIFASIMGGSRCGCTGGGVTRHIAELSDSAESRSRSISLEPLPHHLSRLLFWCRGLNPSTLTSRGIKRRKRTRRKRRDGLVGRRIRRWLRRTHRMGSHPRALHERGERKARTPGANRALLILHRLVVFVIIGILQIQIIYWYILANVRRDHLSGKPTRWVSGLLHLLVTYAGPLEIVERQAGS